MFKRLKNIKGLLYIPEMADGPKKHNCPDCFHCGWCSDARCEVCLSKKAKKYDKDNND